VRGALKIGGEANERTASSARRGHPKPFGVGGGGSAQAPTQKISPRTIIDISVAGAADGSCACARASVLWGGGARLWRRRPVRLRVRGRSAFRSPGGVSSSATVAEGGFDMVGGGASVRGQPVRGGVG